MFFLLDLAAKLDLAAIHAVYRQKGSAERESPWPIANAEDVTAMHRNLALRQLQDAMRSAGIDSQTPPGSQRLTPLAAATTPGGV